MRFHLVAILLLASLAVPATAQKDGVERRIEKLEAELRAVQRKVFPGGNVEPEIRPETPISQTIGVPASTAVVDLNARVDALETQLARLTGQAEESTNRLRQLEDSFSRFRTDMEARLQAATGAASASEPRTSVVDDRTLPAPSPSIDSAPPSADPGEDAYLAGYRLWDQRNYGEAQKTLEAMAKKYPKHRRTSWALNLAGRAYLDDGKPATAAKIFLGNYQSNPKGERAADSLYFLGQALMRLKKPVEACKVYDELQDVYGATLRDFLQQNLPKARAEAKCD